MVRKLLQLPLLGNERQDLNPEPELLPVNDKIF